MAIRGVSTTHIVSGKLGDKSTKSIAGVPGSGLAAAYVYVDLYIKLAVTDDDSLYIAASNGKITQQNMSNIHEWSLNEWRVFLCARPSPFSVTFPTGATSLFQYPRKYSWQDEQWFSGESTSSFTGLTTFPSVGDPTSESDALSKGYYKLPFKITDIDITEEAGTQTWTGTVYLNFPVTYERSSGVTDDMTLSSTQVSVDVTTLLPYYPWAIRKSGSFVSCNRSGGHVKIMKSASWRDVQNYQSDTADNDAHYRSGSSWKRSPLIE